MVASLEETQGLLSHFDRVYSDYITQGGAGVALEGGFEPTCQMLLFPFALNLVQFRPDAVIWLIHFRNGSRLR